MKVDTFAVRREIHKMPVSKPQVPVCQGDLRDTRQAVGVRGPGQGQHGVPTTAQTTGVSSVCQTPGVLLVERVLEPCRGNVRLKSLMERRELGDKRWVAPSPGAGALGRAKSGHFPAAGSGTFAPCVHFLPYHSAPLFTPRGSLTRPPWDSPADWERTCGPLSKALGGVTPGVLPQD